MLTNEERQRLASWLRNHKPEPDAFKVAVSIMARHAFKRKSYRGRLKALHQVLLEIEVITAFEWTKPKWVK